MSRDEREDLVRTFLPPYEQVVRRLWSEIREAGDLTEAELTERLEDIRRRVERMASVVWSAQHQRELAKYGDEQPSGEPLPFKMRPIREQQQTHVILTRVPNEVAYRFRELALEWDGLIEVVDSTTREYRWATQYVRLDRSTLPQPIRGRADDPLELEVRGVGDHILGTMRDQVWESDFERRPFLDDRTGEIVDLGGYRIGDSVGERGLEAVFEDTLRGSRGVMRRNLETNIEERTAPTPGRDMKITIDIALQARVQAILAPAFGLTRVHQYQAGWENSGEPRETGLPIGTPLNAAAVVLEVGSGDILAMVSMPTMADGLALPAVERAQSAFSVNRPVEAIYPPGSILKPIVLAAAVMQGVHRLDDRIECTGHYYPAFKDRARCWIYRPPGYYTHGIGSQVGGPLDGVQALARSCNIYFYTLGNRLGLERLSNWLARFGLGTPFGIGLQYDTTVTGADGETRAMTIGESGGTLPSAEAIDALRRSGRIDFESTIAGIGQGAITWTPLQAAHAFAMLARRGRWVEPRLIIGDDRYGGRRPERDLPMSRELVDSIMDGLHRSVTEDYGTGHHIRYADRRTEPILNATNVTVWAKTGTAQAPNLRLDDDGDGTVDRIIEHMTHAWFVGLVGAGDKAVAAPEYAVVVLVEYGGSGGRTSGPIANQIIRALQDEGYLAPGLDAPGTGGP